MSLLCLYIIPQKGDIIKNAISEAVFLKFALGCFANGRGKMPAADTYALVQVCFEKKDGCMENRFKKPLRAEKAWETDR